MRLPISKNIASLLMLSMCCVHPGLPQSPSSVKIATPDHKTPGIDDGQNIHEPVGRSTWMGFYQDGRGFQWKPAEVDILWAPAPFTEEDAHTKWSGKKLYVHDDPQPLFLVQGLDALVNVPPKQAVYPLQRIYDHNEGLINEQGLRMDLEGSTFVLKNVPQAKDHELVLRSGMRTQRIDTMIPGNDSRWSVLWAGDLDGDGHLDLVIKYADMVNARLMLMLSSRAKPGEFVHLVAKREYAAD